MILLQHFIIRRHLFLVGAQGQEKSLSFIVSETTYEGSKVRGNNKNYLKNTRQQQNGNRTVE